MIKCPHPISRWLTNFNVTRENTCQQLRSLDIDFVINTRLENPNGLIYKNIYKCELYVYKIMHYKVLHLCLTSNNLKQTKVSYIISLHHRIVNRIHFVQHTSLGLTKRMKKKFLEQNLYTIPFFLSSQRSGSQ